MMPSVAALAAVGCLLLVAAAAQAGPAFSRAYGADRVVIEPWGADSLRVRVVLNGGTLRNNTPGALLPVVGGDNKGHPTKAAWRPTPVAVRSDGVTNGNIQATVSAAGLVSIVNVATKETVLQEAGRSSGGASPGTNNHAIVLMHGADCSGSFCCLDLDNWNKKDNASVALSNCHPESRGTNQQWAFLSGGHIQVALDNKCLAATSDTTVVVQTCGETQDAQVWSALGEQASGPLKHSSGLCLTAVEEKDGGALRLEACQAGAATQTWTYSPALGPPGAAVATEAFASSADEQLYGFGEHQQGKLNMKGSSFVMLECLEYGHSHGGEVCLPWVLGARGGALKYGFLWNMPNYGSVSFGDDNVTWAAEAATQLDYFVTVPSATASPETAGFELLHSYVDAVGHAPAFPSYALGYWHSRNRYSSQADLLAAARGFYSRNVSVSIIVIDYHHWVHMGDWSFDNSQWPNVTAMMEELDQMGMKVMVSVWPFSATNSSSIDEIAARDLAVNLNGTSTPVWWNDNNCDANCYLYDPTQPAAREYLWTRLDAGYYKHGIKVYWLDAAEPEISTSAATKAAQDSAYSLGSAQEMGMMFPYFHTQSIHDGLKSAGEEDVIMLTRSAWAGMQRWGAALWSGDTQSTFKSLQVSIPAGLNTQLSGIAWWTTDIGGYSGGNPSNPTFRELIVRWFQFGMTCPIFRQHGARETEIWLLGNESYAAIVDIIKMREELAPYVGAQLAQASATGRPLNRPLFMDFPSDPNVWGIQDQYMFGDSYLVAPQLEQGATSRTLYLPANTKWTYTFSGKVYSGGANVTLATPLNEFPLFKRAD